MGAAAAHATRRARSRSARAPAARYPSLRGRRGAGLLLLAWSPATLARERAAGGRLLRRLGVGAGIRVANCLPGALATPGALLLGDVVEELGALDVPLGALDTEAAARTAWQLIDRVEPAVVVLDAASAGPLFATVPRATRGWWREALWLGTC